MRTRALRGGILAAATTAVLFFVLAACGSREAQVESEPGVEAAAAEWTATIRATEAGGHGGTATATSGEAGGTRATVRLSGGSGGGTHPWHIHRGACGSGGDIVGNPGAYPVLRPDAGGNATETATLNVTLDPADSYHINIHQSPERSNIIVACGELRLR